MKPIEPQTQTKKETSTDWKKARNLLADMEAADDSFGLDTLPVERLAADKKKKKPAEKKDWCVTCDAPKDVCETCDALDCYTDDDEDPDDDDVCITCDAPKDHCQTCDMADCITCDDPEDSECASSIDKPDSGCTFSDPND